MSKVVIFSENSDYSTSVIMKWILFFGKEVSRINRDDPNLCVEKKDRNNIYSQPANCHYNT
ncbi:MAG: hypothetical protein LBS01_03500 [Prevotellaceae bacterium]|jgi:hypothetical protein|nr:hypothetical protein [Prevotellaceae bacterium]